MITTKYYLKEKCNCRCHKEETNHLSNWICCPDFQGFTRGADITELVERFKDCYTTLEHNYYEHNYYEFVKKSMKDLIEVVEE